jgi:hypothetical protein
MKEYIKENIRESVDCKARLLESDSLICKIEEVARLCIDRRMAIKF